MKNTSNSKTERKETKSYYYRFRCVCRLYPIIRILYTPDIIHSDIIFRNFKADVLHLQYSFPIFSVPPLRYIAARVLYDKDDIECNLFQS